MQHSKIADSVGLHLVSRLYINFLVSLILTEVKMSPNS